MKMPNFCGYFVDMKAREFRTVERGRVEFIAFASPRGKQLLGKMSEQNGKGRQGCQRKNYYL